MKNKIRLYAEKCGFEVIGKLIRHPELEYDTNGYTGEKVHTGYKHYIDEGGNEYDVGARGVCITTADGGVI